jgi:hypothetical protein
LPWKMNIEEATMIKVYLYNNFHIYPKNRGLVFESKTSQLRSVTGLKKCNV